MELKLSKRLVSAVVITAMSIILIVSLGKPAETKTSQEFSPVADSKITATVNVKAGYYPQEIVLPANKDDVVLRFVTKNTYDCSASLLIAKLGIDKLLPPTGNTDIAIPKQEPGTVIQAGCSMGMYSFKLKFI